MRPQISAATRQEVPRSARALLKRMAMGLLRPALPRTISLSAYVFAGVLLVRLLVLLKFSASAFLLPAQGDMHFYNDWAQRILHGQWTDHQAFYGLPLYPYLLAALYKVFGYSPFFPAFLQGCADSGTAVILFRLGAHLFAAPRASTAVTPWEKLRTQRGTIVGLLAAGGWACYAPAQAYAAILMPTALAIFVFWFVVWQIVRRQETPRPAVVFLFGLLIGFTAMGIATTLFLAPLFIAALFFKWAGRNRVELTRAAVLSVLLAAGLGLGTLPCWAHNYFVAHEPVLLSAHSGVNFWIGNNPVANGYPKMPPGLHAGQEAMLSDSIKTAERSVGHKLQRAEVSKYWSAKANAYIRENPGAWLRLVGTKIANFWNAFQYDDLSIITNLRLQGILPPGLRFGLVAALALAALPFAARRAREARWVIAAIALHLGSLLTVFVTERYRMAAVPGLMLLAAFGVYLLWENLCRARFRELAVYLALLVATCTFVSIRRGDPSLWALDPYNSGWQALQGKNYSLAQEKLELAYAYVPDNAEINFALGNLQLEQGHTAEAKPWYAATLRLDPTHEGAWNNLGVLALGENRWELAIKFFRGAQEQSPDDPKTHFLMARAYSALGDYARAQAQLAPALRARPEQPEFLELKKTIEAAL